MSFTTKKPKGEVLPERAVTLQLEQGNASPPAFRPQLMRSVRMHPVLAGAVAAVVFCLLAGYALLSKPVYMATVQVSEQPSTGKLLGDAGSGAFDSNRYEAFIAEQMQLMQRMDIVTAAVNSLQPTVWKEYGGTATEAAGNIMGQLKVVRVPATFEVGISLKGTSAQNTADIVNAVAQAYLDAERKATTAESDQRAQLLAEERGRVDGELQAARAEQAELGASIGVANPSADGGNPYDAELSGIRTQLTEARAAHDAAAAQLWSLSGVGSSQGSGLTAAADEAIAGDAGLSSMKATVSSRRAQLNAQMSGMTPTNPIYKQDQDELADLDRTLDRMTTELRDKAARRIQDKLRADLARTGDVEARLNGELNRQIAQATSARPKLQRASEVAADIQRLEAREAAIDDALRGLRMEASSPSQVRVVLPAEAPEHPEPSRSRLLLLAALPLALLLGAFAAVLARKQDRRIYGAIDIEDVLGFPPVAILPSRGDVSERVYEEYVLRLAAGVESAYHTSGARTFLLTAVSLTTDIAPLVDALRRKFEEIGVNVRAATAQELLAPTEGAVPPAETSTEMSRSEKSRMIELWSQGFVAANVAQMKAAHGLVLIESDAVLNCAQAEYVARCADATMLIVECGVTTREELYSAAAMLERLGVTGIGAVLEEVQLRFADAAFRTAIEALNRRPAASFTQPRGSLRDTALVAEPALRREAEKAVTVKAEPVPVVEEAKAEPEVVREVVPEVAAAAVAVEAATLVHEPEAEGDGFEAHGELPIVEVPAVAPVLHAEENVGEDAAIRVANTVSREKIAPTLSARREEPASDGEQSMSRTTSWLDKLLRRDTESNFRIVPDDDEGDVEEAAPVSRQASSTRKAGPISIAEEAARRQAEYDIPLQARLEQISGIRAAAPAQSSRLQIVPPEPVAEPVVAAAELAPVLEMPAVVEAAAEVPAEPVAVAEEAKPVVDSEPVVAAVEPVVAAVEHHAAAVEHEVVASVPTPAVVADPAVVRVRPLMPPARWAHTDRSVEEIAAAAAVAVPEMEHPAAAEAAAEPIAVPIAAPIAAPTAVEAEPVVAEAVEPAAEMVAVPAAVVAEPESKPELIAESIAEPVAEPVVALERGPRRPFTYQELVAMAEQGESEPLLPAPVHAALVEHLASLTAAPAVAAVEPAVTAEVESLPTAEVAEPVVESVAAPVVEEPAAAVAEVVQPDEAPVAEPLVEAVAEPVVEAVAEPEPEVAKVDEVDDIAPVYEEASRTLNTGRWDPIPPLRPSSMSWRDRPSPMPESSNGYLGRDAQMPKVAESLPEPLLTRQWGLLSRFQQARLNSGQHSVAVSESDPNRDVPKPSTNGNHKA